MTSGTTDDNLIASLQSKIGDWEDQIAKLKVAVNAICVGQGNAPLYRSVEGAQDGAISQLQSDTFYGQKLNTSIRNCLEMRKAAGMGPASVREIYDTLRAGGYHFNTSNDDNAMRSLRSSLNKSSQTFHRLPNGDYGLLAWYPEAKNNSRKDRPGDHDDSDGATDGDVADSESAENPSNKEDANAPTDN